MIKQRLSACAVAFVLAALATPAAALAHSHKHARHMSGVVTALNPVNHTLSLRVKHARLHAASAATVTISFGDASVKGPDGAVVVGDTITVTLSSGDQAASITVVGTPNGGSGGNGAAIPGRVDAVDATAGELTLRVSSQSGPADVTISVTPATVIAVPGATIVPTIGAIQVGDRILVFTDDVTADPIVAIAVLDSGEPAPSPTPNPPAPPSDPTRPQLSDLSGTVESVGTVSFTVRSDNDGAFPEQLVTVAVNATTSISGRNSSGAYISGIAGLQTGDQIELYYVTSSTPPLIAYKVADNGARPSDTTPPSPPSDDEVRFGGTVTAVRGDGLTVLVGSGGPLAGQTVIVSVGDSTSLATPHGYGTGASNLAYIAVGDPVEIYTNSESTTPIVARGVVDDSAATGSDG